MSKSVYSVQQINSYISNMFAQDYLLPHICVKGEISNCKYHSSGHIYFTLKDSQSALACVMFAGNRKNLLFELREGMQVNVSGSIEVYARDGKYQLYAQTIEKDGMGSLYEQFEQLKVKLSKEGLFDEEYKRKIPKYVKKLGVVTASTGAAIRDIITVSKRRNPYIEIILYPAIVQGDAAAESIVRGISVLESVGVDCIIVGRGGGSIEDLWAFNEEVVAQAIFQCEVPVISAVGHEVDFTIADFVADVRAATPSAAAELAVIRYQDLYNEIAEYRGQLLHTMQGIVNDNRRKSDRMKFILANYKPMNKVHDLKMRAVRMEDLLQKEMNDAITVKRQALNLYIKHFQSLSPLTRLNHGYAHISNASGNTICDIHDVKVKDQLCIHVKNGKMVATVDEIYESVEITDTDRKD